MKNVKRTELKPEQYLPEALFKRLCIRLGVRTYSALGAAIGLSPSVVSKVRNRKVAISSEILLKIHDATDIPLRELRRWMGDTRPYYSPLSPAVIGRRPVPAGSSARHNARAERSAERTADRAPPSARHTLESYG